MKKLLPLIIAFLLLATTVYADTSNSLTGAQVTGVTLGQAAASTTWIYSGTNTTTPSTYSGSNNVSVYTSNKCARITPPTTQTYTKVSPYFSSIGDATACQCAIWDSSGPTLVSTVATISTPTTGYNDATITGVSLTGSELYFVCCVCNSDNSGYVALPYDTTTTGEYCGTGGGLATSYTGFTTDCGSNFGTDASMNSQMRIGY